MPPGIDDIGGDDTRDSCLREEIGKGFHPLGDSRWIAPDRQAAVALVAHISRRHPTDCNESQAADDLVFRKGRRYGPFDVDAVLNEEDGRLLGHDGADELRHMDLGEHFGGHQDIIRDVAVFGGIPDDFLGSESKVSRYALEMNAVGRHHLVVGTADG